MLELNPKNKLAGVLVPVFALRGADDLGVGDTEAVRELIDFAAGQGLRVVQILPVNAMGGDSSPYNLLSAMALEPTTIATRPKILPDLTQKDFAAITARHDLTALRAGPIQYSDAKALKNELLQAAHRRFQSRSPRGCRVLAWQAFAGQHADWLPDYALHRALLSWHGDVEASADWPEEHRSPAAARTWIASLGSEEKRRIGDLIDFHSYVQWIAFTQWRAVRDHADREGVALMGDVPVGVSLSSADVWRNPDFFDTVHSSGAPPEKVFSADLFTEKWGQNWGFPLYHWDAMRRDDYAWWRRRLRLLMGVFHLLRVDHALGFFRIYSFPWRPEDDAKFLDLTPDEAAGLTGGELPRFRDFEDDTEEHRVHNQRQGEQLFQILLEEIGSHRLIAEDLGEVAPYVRPTLEALEIPGFKIPQWERRGDRLTSGSDYQRLSLATYATHDHPPLHTLWDDLFQKSQSDDQSTRDAAIHSSWELMDFCGCPDHQLPQPFTPEIHEILLRGLFASNSWLAIPMITDIFGTTERFNVPGSEAGKNWTQRVEQPVALWENAWVDRLTVMRRLLPESGRGRK